jgi:DNA-binding XRE family transcriptional regulator
MLLSSLIYKRIAKRYNEFVIHKWIDYHESEGEKNMDDKVTTRVVYNESNLSIRLWNLRNDRGMTIEDLAAKVDVSSRFISQIESGQRYGSIPTLVKIANVLQVTLGSLFE